MTELNDTPSPQGSITRARALEAVIEGTKQEIDAKLDAELLAASAKSVELDGRRRFFGLRDRWSTAIIWWISILIALNCGLTIGVGLAWLKFDNLQWFITSVTIETFLQTVGLGYVAARYLFSDGISAREAREEKKNNQKIT